MSLVCNKCKDSTFEVIASDSSMEDCDLQEIFECKKCGARYEAKYKLISFQSYISNRQSPNQKRTET